MALTQKERIHALEGKVTRLATRVFALERRGFALRVEAVDSAAILPRGGYYGDAGLDLHVVGDWRLDPGEKADLPAGIKVEFPDGVWGEIEGRSSTLRKRGLKVHRGIIDQGYRGELFTYVENVSDEPIWVRDGDRLAQLIPHHVFEVQVQRVDRVAPSDRGESGFGSTGHRTDEKQWEKQ